MRLNQRKKKQTSPETQMFLVFSSPAAPNWFGAEIAHKSVVYQTSSEREFVTHLHGKGFCCAQGLKTFHG